MYISIGLQSYGALKKSLEYNMKKSAQNLREELVGEFVEEMKWMKKKKL